jgi:hypothetical protein
MKNGFPAPNKELAINRKHHLTRKAPYKFESRFLQRRVAQPAERVTDLIDDPRRHYLLSETVVVLGASEMQFADRGDLVTSSPGQ